MVTLQEKVEQVVVVMVIIQQVKKVVMEQNTPEVVEDLVLIRLVQEKMEKEVLVLLS